MPLSMSLDRTLAQIVVETDPVKRAELADHYIAELKVMLRSMNERTMVTVWSEKEDILQQIGDSNTLISEAMHLLNEHNEDSKIYRASILQHLETLHGKIDLYVGQLPMQERAKLIAQIADHEKRIAAIESKYGGDK